MRLPAWCYGALSLLAAACSSPVAANLNEPDANRVVYTLEEKGIAADKESDPNAEGRWMVSVARDDASAAVAVLTQESLPPQNAPGVLAALGEGSIVPSRTAEHAKLVAGTAGELERSLQAIDGVLSARVHLAVPTRDVLAAEQPAQPPTASVLLRFRGATPPISAGDVQRLVAGAIPGMASKDVSVVLTETSDPGRPPERQLMRFGPITVTRSSMLALRLVVGGAALLNFVLIGLLAFLWTRVRRSQHALAELKAAHDAQGAS